MNYGKQTTSGVLQEFAQEHVEVVHAIFPLYGIAPAVIGG